MPTGNEDRFDYDEKTAQQERLVEWQEREARFGEPNQATLNESPRETCQAALDELLEVQMNFCAPERYHAACVAGADALRYLLDLRHKTDRKLNQMRIEWEGIRQTVQKSIDDKDQDIAVLKRLLKESEAERQELRFECANHRPFHGPVA